MTNEKRRKVLHAVISEVICPTEGHEDYLECVKLAMAVLDRELNYHGTSWEEIQWEGGCSYPTKGEDLYEDALNVTELVKGMFRSF